jgi:hypothetical protein
MLQEMLSPEEEDYDFERIRRRRRTTSTVHQDSAHQAPAPPLSTEEMIERVEEALAALKAYRKQFQ